MKNGLPEEPGQPNDKSGDAGRVAVNILQFSLFISHFAFAPHDNPRNDIAVSPLSGLA
jgi:hypothetical protein